MWYFHNFFSYLHLSFSILAFYLAFYFTKKIESLRRKCPQTPPTTCTSARSRDFLPSPQMTHLLLPEPSPPPTLWVPALLPLKGVPPVILPLLPYICFFFFLPDYVYQYKDTLFLLLFKKKTKQNKLSLDSTSHSQTILYIFAAKPLQWVSISSNFSPSSHSQKLTLVRLCPRTPPKRSCQGHEEPLLNPKMNSPAFPHWPCVQQLTLLCDMLPPLGFQDTSPLSLLERVLLFTTARCCSPPGLSHWSSFLLSLHSLPWWYHAQCYELTFIPEKDMLKS